MGKELFFKAQMHKDRQNISHDAWVKIFNESYTLSKFVMAETLDDHDIKVSLEALKITAKENNLDFMARIVKKGFLVLEGGKLLDTSLLPYCREMWTYLALISSLDLNKNSDQEMMKEVFNSSFLVDCQTGPHRVDPFQIWLLVDCQTGPHRMDPLQIWLLVDPQNTSTST